MPGSQSKAPDAFRTIGEVAEELHVAQHVLRFWENKFSPIRPMKRSGGRRYYRRQDIDLLQGIQHLLYEEGLTIKGVQKLLKERGPRYVIEVGRKKSLMDDGAPGSDGAVMADGEDAHLAAGPGAIPQLDLPLQRDRVAGPEAPVDRVPAASEVAASVASETAAPAVSVETRRERLLALRRELVAAQAELAALLKPRGTEAD